MSDPVSNAEIEDVLSSIRRLIAAGDPDRKDDAPASAMADDKLILTPAFRVFSSDTEGADRDGVALPATGRDIPVEQLEQGDPAPTDEVDEDETAEAADTVPPLVLSFDTNMAEPAFLSTSDMPMPPVDSQVDFEDNWDSDALGETAQVAFLHQRVSSVAEQDTSEDAEPEVAEPEAIAEEASESDMTVEDEVSEAESAPEVEAATEAENVMAPVSDQDALEGDDPESVEEEPVQADSGASEDDDAEDQPILADVDDVDPADEPVAEILGTEVLAASVDDAPVAEIIEDDSDFIDEDHLQEIVARIVREELKGEMGVKITQAVRRMVRREVTRALSLEKFD